MTPGTWILFCIWIGEGLFALCAGVILGKKALQEDRGSE